MRAVSEESDAALGAFDLPERRDTPIFDSMDGDYRGLADIPNWILSGRKVVALLHSGCIAELPLLVRDRVIVHSG